MILDQVLSSKLSTSSKRKRNTEVINQNRYYSLEACRGLAAIIVVFRHMCVHSFEGPKNIIAIPSPSATAVMFFFVLSGIVMGLTRDRSQSPLLSSGSFLAKRFLRIFPLYWIVISVTIFVWPFIFKQNLIYRWVFLLPEAHADRVIALDDVTPPAWTLHWEVFFYIVFSFFIATRRKSAVLFTWFILIIVLNSVVPNLAMPRPLLSAALLVTDPLGLFFLSGILVAAIVKKRLINLATAKFVLLSGAIISMCCMAVTDFGRDMPVSMEGKAIAAFGMGLVLLGLIVLEENNRLPIGQWCLVLGQISFPLYISHWLFMDLVNQQFWLRHIDAEKHYIYYAVALTVGSLIGGVAVTYLVDVPIQYAIKLGTRRIPSAQASLNSQSMDHGANKGHYAKPATCPPFRQSGD